MRTPTPLRAPHVEKALEGKPADAASLRQAAHVAPEDARPTDDLRGSVEYKRAMVEVYTHRALVRALERAHGGKA